MAASAAAGGRGRPGGARKDGIGETGTSPPSEPASAFAASSGRGGGGRQAPGASADHRDHKPADSRALGYTGVASNGANSIGSNRPEVYICHQILPSEGHTNTIDQRIISYVLKAICVNLDENQLLELRTLMKPAAEATVHYIKRVWSILRPKKVPIHVNIPPGPSGSTILVSSGGIAYLYEEIKKKFYAVEWSKVAGLLAWEYLKKNINLYVILRVGLLVLHFCGAVVCTYRIWHDNCNGDSAEEDASVNRIVIISDDILGFHKSRNDMVKLCRRNEFHVVLPRSVVTYLELQIQDAGKESQKATAALSLVNSLVELGQMTIIEEPEGRWDSYEEAILNTSSILKGLFPEASVTTATHSKSLRNMAKLWQQNTCVPSDLLK